MNNKLTFLLPYLAIAVFIYLFWDKLSNALKNLIGSVGIGNTVNDEKEIKEVKKEVIKSKPYFNIQYWNIGKKGYSSKLFKMVDTTKMVETIKKGIGNIYDSPQQILATFKKCKYKSQISWLSYHFNLKYKKDLLYFLKNGLDKDNQREILNEILEHTNALPSGFFIPKK